MDGIDFPFVEERLNRKFAALSAIAAITVLVACGGPDAEFAIGDTGATPQATTASQVPLFIPPEYALDFAVPITFIALFAPQLRSVPHLAAALVSVAVSLAAPRSTT